MRLFLRHALLSLIALTTFVLVGGARADDTDSGYARWKAWRDTAAKDPSVIRLYTFEEQPGNVVHNWVRSDGWGDLAVLTNPPYWQSSPIRPPKDFPRSTTGRWPRKNALAFGDAAKSTALSHFYGAADNHFSVELWVRTYAETAKTRTPELCYEDDTATSGWKIATGPKFTIFQLGRPVGTGEGKGIVAVYAPGTLQPDVWHQIVAELDGETLRLFVDGKLGGSRSFDGIYTQPVMPARAEKVPELDTGGLIVGNRTEDLHTAFSPTRTPLFDLDELVIYSRALSAEEVADHFTTGSPGESAEAQIRQRAQEMARKRQCDAITFTMPTERFGYFTRGKPFPVSVHVPADSGQTGPLHARFALTDENGKPITTLTQTLGRAAGNATAQIALPRCERYALRVTVASSGGDILRDITYPLAGTVPLPSIRQIPLTSPLAGHNITQGHPAEVVLGSRIDRTISPFLRILPDGSYDWHIPDEVVTTQLKDGFDVLYTIFPPYNMPHNTPEELAHDPQRWGDWVRTLVGHFKGKVKYWEIWNEPNADPNLSAKDYVTLLKTAYPIIHEVDPAARVLGGGGVYNIVPWTDAVFQAGGGPYMDILSLHNYIGTSPITYRNRYHKVEAVQKLIQKYIGHPLPVWNSEGGIHQPARLTDQPMTDAEMLKIYGPRASSPDGWPVAGVNAIIMTTEHRSACWNIQSILMDLADGDEKYFTLMGAGTFYPFNSPSEGYTTEKGISYAALASVMIPSVHIQWLPLDSAKAAGILVTDTEGKRTAILFSDEPMDIPFAASPGRAFTGMDFLGNPRQWRADTNGLTVHIGDEPVYLFDVPADFAEKRLLAVRSFPKLVSANQSVTGELTLNPMSDGSLPIRIEGRSAAGKITISQNQAGSARTPHTVPFQFVADGVSRGAQTIQFTLKAGDQTISRAEIPFTAEGPLHAIPEATQPILMDCRPWPLSYPTETADSAARVAIGKPDVGVAMKTGWQGADDCSFTVQQVWRANDGLYVRVEVTDNHLFPMPAGRNDPWLWDGLELFVDTRPPASRTLGYSPGVQQIMVIPALDAQSVPCTVLNLAHANATVDAAFVSRASTHGYILEGKITPHPGSGWNLTPEARTGLDFAIDDNDGSGRKSQIVLHGGASDSTDTSVWGTYRLAPSP